VEVPAEAVVVEAVAELPVAAAAVVEAEEAAAAVVVEEEGADEKRPERYPSRNR
jgi:hypothetical protein